MNNDLKEKLVAIVRDKISNDISHDFGHISRVEKLAEKIAKAEGGDLDVVVPAALFHDIVVYKGTSNSKNEHEESSNIAKKVLSNIKEYPKEKIKDVFYSISVCSFSKNIKPNLLEAKILQDADLLEATGAISIMRTFGSSSIMNKGFYDFNDPFCINRVPDDKKYAIDLFFTRLLVAHKRMHTKTAKNMAKRRTEFVKKFLSEFKSELKESNAL